MLLGNRNAKFLDFACPNRFCSSFFKCNAKAPDAVKQAAYCDFTLVLSDNSPSEPLPKRKSKTVAKSLVPWRVRSLMFLAFGICPFAKIRPVIFKPLQSFALKSSERSKSSNNCFASAYVHHSITTFLLGFRGHLTAPLVIISVDRPYSSAHLLSRSDTTDELVRFLCTIPLSVTNISLYASCPQ